MPDEATVPRIRVTRADWATLIKALAAKVAEQRRPREPVPIEPQGRYRASVTLNGFTCLSETWDDWTQRDGAGDEIWFEVDVRAVAPDGSVRGQPETKRTAKPAALILGGIAASIPAVLGLAKTYIGVAGDRPVGQVEATPGGERSYDPSAFVIDLARLRDVAQLTQGFGPGVFQIFRADSPRLAGNYVLWLEVGYELI